jgi:hypothetical protein
LYSVRPQRSTQSGGRAVRARRRSTILAHLAPPPDLGREGGRGRRGTEAPTKRERGRAEGDGDDKEPGAGGPARDS